MFDKIYNNNRDRNDLDRTQSLQVVNQIKSLVISVFRQLPILVSITLIINWEIC